MYKHRPGGHWLQSKFVRKDLSVRETDLQIGHETCAETDRESVEHGSKSWLGSFSQLK